MTTYTGSSLQLNACNQLYRSIKHIMVWGRTIIENLKQNILNFSIFLLYFRVKSSKTLSLKYKITRASVNKPSELLQEPSHLGF